RLVIGFRYRGAIVVDREGAFADPAQGPLDHAVLDEVEGIELDLDRIAGADEPDIVGRDLDLGLHRRAQRGEEHQRVALFRTEPTDSFAIFRTTESSSASRRTRSLCFVAFSSCCSAVSR